MADLTDAQWARPAPSIPVVPRRPDGNGRPRVDNRAILHPVGAAQWRALERPARAVAAGPDLPSPVPGMD